MYFNQASGFFSTNEDMSRIVFEWQVGRLYGRGFLINIELIDNKILIKNKDLIWVS